jgi:predicted AlkP superfamily pyrophosphatase or phosphodiesterase
MHERQILHTYFQGRSGDIILIPKPYFMPGGKNDTSTTHLTGYSYDRTVPIIFAGYQIKPGIYSTRAEAVDIAPTLSFLARVLPPSLSEGRVLSEALR